MKKFFRTRLKPAEATHLGLTVKPFKNNEDGFPRYMISEVQKAKLTLLRDKPEPIKTKVVKSKNNDDRRILVIGDLHEPFCLEGYLEFCKETYDKYNCNQVVFIGDVIDNHYSSFHETSPEGHGGDQELQMAKTKIAKWAEAFPVADVMIGNHDRLIMRKAQSSDIPREWIREYKDVLNTPGWNFIDSVEYDDVKYVHGEGGTARMRIKSDMQSVVQGHLHTQCYTEWLVGAKFKVFGSQVGCGIDHRSYAMAYAKAGKKPAIGCMVVLDQGKTPINITMDL